MRRQKEQKRVCQKESVRNEKTRRREICQMVTDPAAFCYIKLHDKSFLLASKYSKGAMRQAIESGRFDMDEVEAIGRQIAETNELRKQMREQKERRFAQYVAGIKACIVQRYTENR